MEYEETEAALTRVTRDGVIHLSDLTMAEREVMLKASKDNMEQFEMYVVFRRKMDSMLHDQLLNGESVKVAEMENLELVKKAMGDVDPNKLGAAALGVRNGADIHMKSLAQIVINNLMGGQKLDVPSAILDALIKLNGLK